MQDYKQAERTHYEEKAQELLSTRAQFSHRDVHGLDQLEFSCYTYLYSILPRYVSGKMVLDYGCGTGLHSIYIAEQHARVTGIDISPSSLKIAQARAFEHTPPLSLDFQEMDCESLRYDDNTFDVVFDGGTFSSIDLAHAVPEIARILKPGGYCIAIETLAHNPITNLKRKINAWRGSRTNWALNHIMRVNDLARFTTAYTLVEARYFHLLSLLPLFLRKLPYISTIIPIADHCDQWLFSRFPSLRRYAFKGVFIFQKKYD